MARFVVFLRAINVGGHSVTKTKLEEAFADLGYPEASIYKQSGNVIIETNDSAKEAEQKIETGLHQTLGYEVATFVRTIPQLKALIKLAAFKGYEKEGASFLVTFLPQAPKELPLKLPLTIPKSKAQVISNCGTEVFSVTYGGGEGGLPNPFLESKLKIKATTRNMNTINEIVEKFS